MIRRAARTLPAHRRAAPENPPPTQFASAWLHAFRTGKAQQQWRMDIDHGLTHA
jgi:hypothetical protein